ncbi:MAG: prepilin peptidase [Solirubrobacteraceae bacterium]
METAFAGVLGAIFGSFLNVLAERLPRRESLMLPASHCASCGTRMKAYEKVPVLSWLALRGRCRACGTRISIRYPLVELTSAALCVGVVLEKGSAAALALGLALVALLVPLALIDAEHRVLPNAITLPGCVLAVVLGLALDPAGEPARLVAGVGVGGLLLVVAVAKPGGMGMGDVKLGLMLGLFLGGAVIPALLVALVGGVVAGGVLVARVGVAAGRRTAVPFGPFLALGALVGLFAGSALLHWYTTTLVA